MADSKDDDYGSRGIIATVKNSILLPPRILLSRTSLRTYLRTLLLLCASVALFATALAAYASFYYAYVPARGFTLPVHLAFDDSYLDACGSAGSTHESESVLDSIVGHHREAKGSWKGPTGTVDLARGSLATEQKYDVSVELDLPRSEQNLAVGNFMVEVVLLGPWHSDGVEKETEGTILARAQRPAMLTYRSWLVETAWKVTRLPWYVLGWRVESERVGVRVLEGVSFEKGWRNVPRVLRVEVRSGRGRVLQVYGVRVEIRARFEGLRYIMHNYRFLSLLTFTTFFYTVEMAFLLLTWGLFSLFFSRPTATPPPKPPPRKRENQPSTSTIKSEDQLQTESDSAALSDASRTFPTFSRQPALRYSAPKIKEEDDEQERARLLAELPPRPAGDADDEDEDEDEDADFVLDETPGMGMGGVPSDSGLGTSMESSGGGAFVRRRSGGSGKSRST